LPRNKDYVLSQTFGLSKLHDIAYLKNFNLLVDGDTNGTTDVV
jgi:hypothetical protein